ncbi:unnamed protein product [Calicophoron daubneyi]|uniref:Uncharacterized protein n=1 Tax=Calicophoron daubneyi TaxID=300641 RepID=A0AAV2TFQ9_CALDB
MNLWYALHYQALIDIPQRKTGEKVLVAQFANDLRYTSGVCGPVADSLSRSEITPAHFTMDRSLTATAETTDPEVERPAVPHILVAESSAGHSGHYSPVRHFPRHEVAIGAGGILQDGASCDS